MTQCSRCSKDLSSGSTGHRTEIGLVCNSCFSDWRKVIGDYTSRYLSGKDVEFIALVLSFSRRFRDDIQRGTLEPLRRRVEAQIAEAKRSSTARPSRGELGELTDPTKFHQRMLDFMGELEKLRKVLQRKGVETGYYEITSVLTKLAQERIDQSIDDVASSLKPILERKLGEDVTTESVVKEYLKLRGNEEALVEVIAKLLDKFGLSYSKGRLEELVNRARENIELEEFERSLGGAKSGKLAEPKEAFMQRMRDRLRNVAVPREAIEGLFSDIEKLLDNASSAGLSPGYVEELVEGMMERLGEQLPVTFEPTKLEAGRFIYPVNVRCQECGGEFQYDVDIRTQKSILKTSCHHCGARIEMGEMSVGFSCAKCSATFDNLEEAQEHTSLCKESSS